jgi:hypothetical protein
VTRCLLPKIRCFQKSFAMTILSLRTEAIHLLCVSAQLLHGRMTVKKGGEAAPFGHHPPERIKIFPQNYPPLSCTSTHILTYHRFRSPRVTRVPRIGIADDAWQLANEFQSNWVTKEEQEGVLQYGLDFMEQLQPVYTGGVTKNGAFITSCICHGCPWPALTLEGKNPNEHYADWFYGKTSGIDSMHIDPRLPNGNGTLTGAAFKSCTPYPYPQA